MEELLRIANEDEQAFSQLFHRYRDKIFAVAFKLTDSSTMAGEVVQEVFLKVWMRRDTLAGINDPESYLFIMARNCVFSSLKKIARRQAIESDWQSFASASENSTENKLETDEYTELLRQAVEALPLQQKQVYILSHEEEMTRNEIAELLQISPETVKTHLSRAVKTVRAFFTSRLGITICFLLVFFLI
jgi:RNA polymerase sigma-70 factor (family 1)